MPGGRFEAGLVGVRVERLGRRVHAQRFRVAFGEAVRGFEAFRVEADLRQRVALDGGELTDRRVERVLRVEDGLRRAGDRGELRLERGHVGRRPVDAGRHGADAGGVGFGPVVEVAVAAGNEVVFCHERSLRRRAADCRDRTGVGSRGAANGVFHTANASLRVPNANLRAPGPTWDT